MAIINMMTSLRLSLNKITLISVLPMFIKHHLAKAVAHLVKTFVDGYKLSEELNSHLKKCLCQNMHSGDLHLLIRFRHKWAEYVQHRVKVGVTETKLMTMSELMQLSNLLVIRPLKRAIHLIQRQSYKKRE